MPMRRDPLRHDLGALSRASQILLGIQAVVAGLSLANTYARGFLIDDATTSLLGLLQIASFAVAGICVLIWTYRAKANTRTDGARDLLFSPTMAVASYFIPLLNLVMPLQAMREIYKASVDPRDWEAVAVPALFGWWWAFWIAGNIAGLATFRMATMEPGMVPADVVTNLAMASDVGTLLASVLLMRGIGLVTGLQARRTSEPIVLRAR